MRKIIYLIIPLTMVLPSVMNAAAFEDCDQFYSQSAKLDPILSIIEARILSNDVIFLNGQDRTDFLSSISALRTLRNNSNWSCLVYAADGLADEAENVIVGSGHKETVKTALEDISDFYANNRAWGTSQDVLDDLSDLLQGCHRYDAGYWCHYLLTWHYTDRCAEACVKVLIIDNYFEGEFHYEHPGSGCPYFDLDVPN